MLGGMNYVPIDKGHINLVTVMANDRHYLFNLRDSPPAWANREALHAALDAVERSFSDVSVMRVQRVMPALFAYCVGIAPFPARYDTSAPAIAIRAYVGVERSAKLRTVGFFFACMLAGAVVVGGFYRLLFW